MLPEAKSGDLLYLSSETGNKVYVLTYPQGKLVGTLMGFTDPGGLCSDRAGNVFVTDGEGQDIIEYAHGETQPIATLQDSGYVPWSCSADAITGNLAVANLAGGQGDRGNIAIFPDEQSPPRFYTDGSAASYQACGYDNDGNLFVVVSYDRTDFAELPKDRNSFVNFKVLFHGPSGVMRDGKYVALSTVWQNHAVINRLVVSGHKIRIVKQIALTSGSHKVYLREFWIQGNRIIGTFSNYVGFWAYPKGGEVKEALRRYSHGVTVSLAPQHSRGSMGARLETSLAP
jgi:hypothetical protein